MGRALAGEGAVYWGYTGKINTPAENADLVFLFVPIFEYIRDTWHSANSGSEQQDALTQIAILCDRAADTLDELSLADQELDVLSAALCLLHIWARLRVWTGDAASPEHHPRAPMPLLLM